MKQVYNNQVNQNLNIIQKIFDIQLKFPDSSEQINNIYLEKESYFAFILYYTDKFKRLDTEGWYDYLECMKNLKVKNEMMVITFYVIWICIMRWMMSMRCA